MDNPKEGLVAFLSGSMIKGIGKVYAQKIADAVGERILDLAKSNAPEETGAPEISDIEMKLREIPGMGESKIADIKESLSALKASPGAVLELYSAEISDSDVEKIAGHYGKRLDKILRTDPYDMVEKVWKLPFFTADKIGKHSGIAPDDPRRIMGGILTAVKFYAAEGSMFATEEQALKTATKILHLDEETIRPHIDRLVDSGRLIRSFGGLYLPVYYEAEKQGAEKLNELIKKSPSAGSDIIVPDRDLDGHLLSAEQRLAIETVMKHPVSVITGGPGTGKTTTVRGVVSLFERMGKKVELAAPTGRAAKRMSVLTGGEAKTIHRLLGYSMGKGYRNKKFEADVLVIDEASMLEQVLFNHLLQALDSNTKVVLVGDTDQLPAIGAGNVLKDMIDSGAVPVVNLKENFRQAEGSLIAAYAQAIREGAVPEKAPCSDFVLVEERDSKNVHERLLSLVAHEIPSYTGITPQDIQVVTPQQEGPLGAKQLNKELQQLLNPNSPQLQRGLKTFRLGDRVMQIVNSGERKIYNGETGRVSDVNLEEGTLEVTFNDGKKSRYKAEDFKELALAYATTVHKLQGSETDNMVLVVTTVHKPMLYRNLIYTGVSRAKKLCVLVGETEALETAVKTQSKTKRNSNFKFRLRKDLSQRDPDSQEGQLLEE